MMRLLADRKINLGKPDYPHSAFKFTPEKATANSTHLGFRGNSSFGIIGDPDLRTPKAANFRAAGNAWRQLLKSLSPTALQVPLVQVLQKNLQ